MRPAELACAALRPPGRAWVGSRSARTLEDRIPGVTCERCAALVEVFRAARAARDVLMPAEQDATVAARCRPAGAPAGGSSSARRARVADGADPGPEARAMTRLTRGAAMLLLAWIVLWLVLRPGVAL